MSMQTPETNLDPGRKFFLHTDKYGDRISFEPRHGTTTGGVNIRARYAPRPGSPPQSTVIQIDNDDIPLLIEFLQSVHVKEVECAHCNGKGKVRAAGGCDE
jgi:hypothetical protein